MLRLQRSQQPYSSYQKERDQANATTEKHSSSVSSWCREGINYNTIVAVFYGYTPTSPHCLDVAEALFLTAEQYNILETTVYTLSQCSRQLGKGLGQFVSGTTEQLSFFQSFFFLFPLLFFSILFLFFCLNYLFMFILQLLSTKHVQVDANDENINEEESENRKDELTLFLLEHHTDRLMLV